MSGYDSGDEPFDVEEYLNEDMEDVEEQTIEENHEKLRNTMISNAIQSMCQKVVVQQIPFVENGPHLDIVVYLEKYEIRFDVFSEAQLIVYRDEMIRRLDEYNRLVEHRQLLLRQYGTEVAVVRQMVALRDQVKNKIIKAEDALLRMT